jgi:hypothetical protein
MQTSVMNPVKLIESVYQKLKQAREVHDALDQLFNGLHEIKHSSSAAEWEVIAGDCRRHRLTEFLHQDPFTARAFRKPRGYAGDAVMMDFAYEWGKPERDLKEVSPLGRRICYFMGGIPSARAVRAQRDLLSDLIDEAAAKVPAPHILSIACGHLREASLSRAVRQGRVGRFVALDQDRESLAVVERTLSRFGVEAVHGSVRGILNGSVVLPGFDMIYTAGLYDYLSQPVATRLTEILFGWLNPGGRLLVANFLPEIRDSGYMEAFMDWKLIYRDEEALEDPARSLPAKERHARDLFVEDQRNIAFLDIRRN